MGIDKRAWNISFGDERREFRQDMFDLTQMPKLFSLQKDGRVRNSHFASCQMIGGSAKMLYFRRSGKYLNTDTAKITVETSVTVPYASEKKKIVEFERAEHTYLPP